MADFMRVQKQIRDNATDVKNYVSELDVRLPAPPIELSVEYRGSYVYFEQFPWRNVTPAATSSLILELALRDRFKGKGPALREAPAHQGPRARRISPALQYYYYRAYSRARGLGAPRGLGRSVVALSGGDGGGSGSVSGEQTGG